MLKYTGERLIPGIPGLERLEMEHRLRYLFASQFASGRRVLDLGSGEGYGTASLARAASAAVGVELDVASVVHAREKYAARNLFFVAGDAAHPPLRAKSFDLVTCFELVEHVRESGELVAAASRLLAPSGIFVCSTPNLNRATKRFEEHNVFHVREYSRDEFLALCESSFRHVCILPQRDEIRVEIGKGAGRRARGGGEEGPSDEPPFFIAVCANEELPRGIRGIGLGRPDDITPRLLSELRRHRASIEEKNAQMRRLREALERYRKAQREKNRELARINEAQKRAARERERLGAQLKRAHEECRTKEDLLGRWRRYAGTLRREKEEVFTTKRWKIGSAVAALLRLLTLRRPQRLPIMDTPPSPDEAPPRPAPAPAMPAHEVREKRREIVTRQKRMLERRDWPAASPLVSIVILNRDGEGHLRRCLPAILKNTAYPRYELIVVDNGSQDGSCDYLKSMERSLRLTLVRNDANRSFAEANNQGIEKAAGEYILFLNNDTEPLEGWLGEMVACFERHARAGAVGAKLIYPHRPGLDNQGDEPEPDFTVQHMGIAFRRERDFIRPCHVGKGAAVDEERANEEREVSAVTCACMLTKREVLAETGPFDTRYTFGFEDVDLCLRMGKAGRKIYYCPSAALFHHEFGTQNVQGAHWKKEMRRKNTAVFREKWFRYLDSVLWSEKMSGRLLFSATPLHIGITVTEDDPQAGYGDYYTASELRSELEALGWRVSFFARRGECRRWEDLPPDLDLLIVLFHHCDIRRLRRLPHIVKVAWVRNWVEEWVKKPWFTDYDIVLASSAAAARLIEKEGNKRCDLFYLATNPRRFRPLRDARARECDYLFIGNYWDAPRDIADALEVPQNHRFLLYGKNWERHPTFSRWARGPLAYEEIAAAYNAARLVLDDSNHVTKPFGQVNSRVFDALACGKLVITNNELGSRELFGGRLPFYRTARELNEKIRYYLEHQAETKALAAELRETVLSRHTYAHRAEELRGILRSWLGRRRICIKIGVPRWDEVESWGDYHMARALKKYFERLGHRTVIQVLEEWGDPADVNFHVAIHLRGLSVYRTKPYHANIMWNISHPKNIPDDEYERYDTVLVASARHAASLKKRLSVEVRTLLQCTDPELFHPDGGGEESHDLLFVGNSRGVFRKVLKDLLPTKHDLAVYGKFWEDFIDDRYIVAPYYPYERLRLLYGSAAIVLNDHWDDMRQYGFVSNRIYDVLASGGFVISDYMPELEEQFGDSVATYRTPEELREAVDYFLARPDERMERARRGRAIVLERHTFAGRVREILSCLPPLQAASARPGTGRGKHPT